MKKFLIVECIPRIQLLSNTSSRYLAEYAANNITIVTAMKIAACL
jgi:hypothetical protein